MAHSPAYNHVDYLKELIRTDELRASITNAVRCLKDVEFDAIAFRGMSGALIAPALALEMDKTLIMVRKSTERSHTWLQVEGDAGARKYIIVDDLIDSGDTVHAIIDGVKRFAPTAECAGMHRVCKANRMWR